MKVHEARVPGGFALPMRDSVRHQSARTAVRDSTRAARRAFAAANRHLRTLGREPVDTFAQPLPGLRHGHAEPMRDNDRDRVPEIGFQRAKHETTARCAATH